MRLENDRLGERLEDNGTNANELCASVISRRPLILVSNRGPVEHHMVEGQVSPRRGSGSVVTSFAPLAQKFEFTWVSSAMGEGDRSVSGGVSGGGALAVRSPLPGHRIFLRYVTTPRRAYHKYYNVICNPLLWFLQHYMWNPPYNPTIDANVHDAWETGYVPVNEAFAKAVVSEARRGESAPVVMGHDYHLYLLPEMVRRELPEATIQHYLHVPWPAPLYWNLLPRYIVRRICESLCSANIVGFQTEQDRRSFLDAIEEFVPDARVDRTAGEVELYGQRCAAKVYPGSINVEEVQRIAAAPRTLEYEARIRAEAGQWNIVRIDRAEPNKNVIRGFRAYELLLNRNPELKGRVQFLAFLVPSRTHLRQYQRYLEEVKQTIQQVNGAHGNGNWQPIILYMENNYAQAIAGMKLYDVLLVNSLVEGMNLVAKEGPVVNTRDGVLVLSQSSGAHPQMSEGAISVAPADVEGTGQALHQALAMPASERRRRAALLYSRVCRYDNYHCLSRQFRDIAALL